MMFENIPAELRALPQWVCAGTNKIPINPRTGEAADPTNPATGGTFAEAVHCGMQHIGFILGKDDPFTIIDLDDPWQDKHKNKIDENHPDFPKALEMVERHSKIYESFETYTELSQSGTGVHLVMMGNIPCGVRRDKVEIYSSDRYMIFTGNVLKNAPVSNCQPLLDQIFGEMKTLVNDMGELIEEEPILEDARIWSMGINATNGEKFIKLCEGEWQAMGFYESQSEADYGLISMLAFYTRSNEQVRRMFRQTVLGQRPKATKNDTYINRSLLRIRSKEPALVDVSSLMPVPPQPPPAPPERTEINIETLPQIGQNPKGQYTFPPGLVGDVAAYILSSAIRPVPEVALAAALALCAGICGRSYNISGTGLNQYIILLAKTGRGKEGAATGIDALIAAVRQTIPMADTFLGPAAFASGQALVKVLDGKPCFVSVLGEFGLTLQQICDPNAPGPQVMLRRVLLDIYAKSGWSKMLRASVYSDANNNTKVVQAPNVTLLGESTPETFFNGLDSSHIAEGLIPRFTIIDYSGPRPPTNPNAFHPPGVELLDRLASFITLAVGHSQNYTCCPVSMDAAAKRIFDVLNLEADRRINGTALDSEAELWNRAHLKALKIGALVAAGCNPHSPVITSEIADWACALIRREIGGIMERFTSGDVGTGEDKQESEIRRLFNHFQTLTPEQRANHRCPDGLIAAQICPISFLTIYTRRLACFKNDRRGSGRALSECLADMVKREIFEMVPLGQLKEQFKTRSAIYYPGPAW